jgi:uncharacterized metal-binding protein
MAKATPDFSLNVGAVKGFCPAGEIYAEQNIAARKIPVLACEGPCIRGEVARLAANLVAEEAPYARCCYAETFLVPGADKAIVIDGCFLKCIGRVMKNVIEKEKVISIDAFPMYKEYKDTFLYTDVPEETRNRLAREVAGKVLEELREEQVAVA